MGFICEHYNDHRAGLVVAFRGDESTHDYCAGDSVENAMVHFNLYLSDGVIMARSDSEVACARRGYT